MPRTLPQATMLWSFDRFRMHIPQPLSETGQEYFSTFFLAPYPCSCDSVVSWRSAASAAQSTLKCLEILTKLV